MSRVTRATPDRWVALQRDLGQRLSKRLFDDVSSRPIDLAERGSTSMAWSLKLAYSISCVVYATSVAFGFVGAALLLGRWTNLFVPLLGVLMVLLCVAARPRVTEPPFYLLSRAEFPTLYELSDRVARSVGTAPIDGIAVSADFNANYRIAGWRRKRYVELGAPLLAILSPEERVALIAHELSHGANNDPLRGQFLFGAVNTLSTWAKALRPVSIGNLGEGLAFGPIVSLVAIPFEYLMRAASELVFLVAKGVLLLVLRQSQRAEYLADVLAATVAGSKAMQDMLEKLYLFRVVDAVIRTHALTRPNDELEPKLTEAARSVPDSELESYRAASRAENWQVDATHPPTALRIDMLASRASHAPRQLLTQEEVSTLEAEIRRLVASTQRELVNRKLEEAYGG